VRDESDRSNDRSATDTLASSEPAASSSDRGNDDFIAMVARELRGSLADIVEMLRIIRSPDFEPSRIIAASESMQHQVDQLVRLVDDLLDTGRVAGAGFRLNKEAIELNVVCNQAIAAVRPLFLQKEQILTVNLPVTSACANGDPHRLARVVENILNNACKFTPSGGRIDITVENDSDASEIHVRDSGIGLAANQLQAIFGLGIGLTWCKRIVELHGGTIVATSAGLRQGSEFVVRLPNQSSAANPSSPPALAPIAPRRILVVDDNRDGAASLARVLELSGQHTRVAADGLSALREAEAFRPDVVLLDIGLPKLNGFEVARRIRQQSWGQLVILVAVTGWGQEEHRRESSDAGFDAHLVKPVDPIKLVRLLPSLTRGD